ncbi:MAG: hypothetical protein HY034_06170 [Nitrospirae bacterium]|nr:hypothetical protein [Nitrospirota bacterium]
MIKKMVLVFVLLLFPSISFADELVLEKGKGVAVCEAYLESIKRLSLQEMVCGEKLESNDIKRPKWERLELKENKELTRKIEKFLEGGDQFVKVKMYDDEKEFEHYLNGPLKNSFIRIAEVDIANSGKAEKVLLYNARLCKIERRYYYARPLLILDEAKNQIDVKKTEPLLQNTTKEDADIGLLAIGHEYKAYDILFYKDTAYFNRWDVDDWTLTVYRQLNNKVKEVCMYKYIFDKPLIKEDY